MIVTTRIRKVRRPGLTLMEVMVVAAILVVLAGVGAISVLGYMDIAKKQAAKAGLTTLDGAVETFNLQNKQYPDNLLELTQTLPNGSKALLDPKALEDPWGGQYQYDASQRHRTSGKPLIYTNGDGSGTRITSWDP